MTGLEGSVLLLCLAYVLLSVLLLAVMAWLPLPRFLKIAAILAASAFYVVVFFATQGLLGWSAPVAVPDRFQVLWTRVIEPNPARHDPGAIHLWLEALDDANLPSGVPRAYLLPYSPELALKVSGAQELRVKESDRITMLARGFAGLGIRVDEYEDGFTIHGGPPAGGEADAAGDHRLAMAFAIAGSRARGPVHIAGADAVAVSYPGFFDELERIAAGGAD